MPEQNILSKNLLKSFIPIGMLTDEQLDLLVQKSEVLHLYKGQTLVRAGDVAPMHYYLIHGSLAQVSPAGDLTILHAVEAVDGPVELNVCLEPGDSCERKACCPRTVSGWKHRKRWCGS